MLAKILSILVLLSFTTASGARDTTSQLTAIEALYRAGDLNGALQQLEPLLAADDLDQASMKHVRDTAAHVLQRRGEELFRQARIAESIADFDRQVKLQPDQAAAHWQRGIAYYYAGAYEQGARQFELHRTINPQDVENAAWHFLCTVRAPNGSLEVARKKLIPVVRDSRVPMANIHKMFAGKISPEDVLPATADAEDAAEFYADLYIGLYYEALGRNDESLHHIERARDNPAAKNNYMGDVARVHGVLRKKAAAPTQP